jgi:hypothetical protein
MQTPEADRLGGLGLRTDEFPGLFVWYFPFQIDFL